MTVTPPSVVANNAITVYWTGVTAVTCASGFQKRVSDAYCDTTTKTSGRRSPAFHENGFKNGTVGEKTDEFPRNGRPSPRRNNRNEVTPPSSSSFGFPYAERGRKRRKNRLTPSYRWAEHGLTQNFFSIFASSFGHHTLHHDRRGG